MRLGLAGLAVLALLLSACAARPPAGDAPLRQAITSAALAQAGKPYHYGGAGPDAFDCSGLVQYAYAQAGLKIPRTTAAQFASGRHISANEAAPADLLFYRFEDKKTGPSHVVLYLGEGEAVHAPASGGAVRKLRVDNPGFSQRLIGARRLLN